MPGIDFDVNGARQAGYNDAQIADALATKANFDSTGARQAGFKDVDIIARLTTPTTSKPAVPAQSSFVDDIGPGEAALIGAGRTFDRIGKGMQQIYYTGKSKFESPTLSSLVTGETPSQKKLRELKAEADDDTRLYEPLQNARPIATGIGEALPSIVATGGIGAGATVLGTTAKLAAAGAIPAALEYGSPEERIKAAAFGGAGNVVGGQVVPKVLQVGGKVVSNNLRGLVGKVTPEALELAAKAEQYGIKVNAAQLGDSKFIKTLASSLEQMPFTGAAEASSTQRGQFTRAVSKTFGENVDKVTPEVYAAARTRLGKQFDDLSMRNTLNVDDELIKHLNAIKSEATQMADDGTIKAVNNTIDRIMKQSTTSGQLFHGGTYNAGDDLTRPLFTAPHPDSAKTYIGMATDRGMKSPKMSQFSADLKSAAPESVINAEARKIGIDPEAGTPASVFDSELHGDAAVNMLVKNLKKIGYDHAILGDIPYGQGKEFNSTILFPGIKPKPTIMAAQEIPGVAYSSMDQSMGNIIKAGGEKGNYIKQIQLAVRDAMDKSISPIDKTAWDQTRGQYKNLKAVRDIVARDAGDGNIPPMQLLNALNNTEAGKEAMAMGTRGNLGEIGRIGRQFVRDAVPNSGTAQRALAMGLIGGGGYAFGASPVEVAGMLAGGATAGKLINKILMSPKTVKALSEQGLTVAQLMKMPPSKITQIIGGASGMVTTNNMEK